MEIWNSDKFKEFRWRVISGKAPSFCIKNCMSYFLERPEQSFQDISMPAIENDIDRVKEQAFKLWENGEKERSWQLLLIKQ